MPRPDFRKLAADRLGTPEPMSGRIAALLGIDARLLDTLLPVEHVPVTTPVRPSSRHSSTTLFNIPAPLLADGPVVRGVRPAPRRRSFAIAPAMLAPAVVPSILSVASAPVAAPVSAPSTTGRKRPSRRASAAAPVLSVASAPVVAPASASSRTGTERKRPSRRKSLLAAAQIGQLLDIELTVRERDAIMAAILGTGVSAVAATPVAPVALVATRRAARPRRVAKPRAPVSVAPVAPAAPATAALSTPTVSTTTTRSVVSQPGVPAVSGPSPVGDARGSVGAILTPQAVAGPVLFAADETEQLLLGDASSGRRESAQAAFSDALSHLVTTISAADGRPESALERARLRKFLQISRIYLDNLAVKLKD